MPLSADLESLILQRPMCRDTANQYRKSIRCYSEFLKRSAQRKDLHEPLVNRWLLHLQEGLSPDTVRGRKTGIVVVWNWLASCGKVKPYHPAKLRKIKRPQRPPVAWSIPQVHTLLKAAEQMRGTLACGVPASQLLTAWIWLAYETALRPSDLLSLRSGNVTGQTITIVQRKTGRVHVATITETARAVIGELLGGHNDRLFPVSKSAFRKWELSLFESAKQLGFYRGVRQGLGTLRKTNATEVCRQSGIHAAAQSLGHVSGIEVARRHYIQPDALGLPVPPPFLLGGDNGQAGACNQDNQRGA